MSPLLSLLPSLLLSCGDPPECDAERPCQGFGQVCVEGACQSHACATSASCPMESHCEGGQCEAGCAQDTDCYPGDACDPATGTCAEAAVARTATARTLRRKDIVDSLDQKRSEQARSGVWVRVGSMSRISRSTDFKVRGCEGR